MKPRRVALIGATGFLGAATKVAFRTAGHHVTTVGRSVVNDVRVDLAKTGEIPSALDQARCDSVVNCAAAVDWDAHVTPMMYAVNVLAPAIIAQWCCVTGARLIHVSSTLVYGARRKRVVATDNESADTAYARTKLVGDQAIQVSSAEATIVRFCGIFGADGPTHLGLNRAIRDAKACKPLSIVATGSARRNYIYVKDAADMLIELLDRSWSGVFVSGGSQTTAIREMVEIISSISGCGDSPAFVAGVEASDQIVEPSPGLPQTRTFRAACEDIFADRIDR